MLPLLAVSFSFLIVEKIPVGQSTSMCVGILIYIKRVYHNSVMMQLVTVTVFCNCMFNYKLPEYRLYCSIIHVTHVQNSCNEVHTTSGNNDSRFILTPHKL